MDSNSRPASDPTAAGFRRSTSLDPKDDTVSFGHQQRIYALLLECAGLDETARNALLDASEPDVARDVRALLEADETGDHFLGTGALVRGVDLGSDAEPLLAEGTQIGPYEILEVLGVGGMGHVYLAQQSEPIDRQVALKVLRFNLVLQENRWRFSVERQIMARLDHPNVCRILDAGTAEDGSPYLAMEPIEGTSITAYCDEARLSIDQRLRLFVQVCRGVDHAHQKFLLHRDIKPSNVLVTRVDGEPVPKLIDFGIAKVLDESFAAGAPVTGRHLLGTPMYMSPEALGLGGDLDTRSDVFSLGILLYELLTGALPWHREGDNLASFLQTRANDEPESPSRLAAEAPAAKRQQVAQQRDETADGLIRRLRGDLDGIALKAIAAQAEQRYASAADFAADVERFLADEPVSAQPPTAVYLLRKALRRHRTVTLASVAVLLALIVGTVSTSIGFVQARERTREALLARDESNHLAEFMVELLEEARPIGEGGETTVRELLDRSAEMIGPESKIPEANQALFQGTIGRIYLNWYLLDQAEHHLETALALYEQEERASFGHFRAVYDKSGLLRDQGRYEDSFAMAERAQRLLERLDVSSAKWHAKVLDRLGSNSRNLGELEESETYHRRALDLRLGMVSPEPQDLASSYLFLGLLDHRRRRYEGAVENFELSLELREQAYGPDSQNSAAVLNNLGNARYRLGQYAEAEAAYRRGLAIRKTMFDEDSLKVGQNLINLGNALRAQGKNEEAGEALRRSLKIFEAQLPEHHPLIANGLFNLGDMTAQGLGRLEDAKPYLLRALTIRRTYDDPHPDVALSLVSLGEIELKLGELSEAERYFRETLEVQGRIQDAFPMVTAAARFGLGAALHRQGETAEAETWLEEAVEQLAELGAEERLAAAQQELTALRASR